MSDDLISRKVVLKELREILNEPHNTMFLMGIGAAVSIIEHREIAFDKEKVIEELKRRAGEECKQSQNKFSNKDLHFGMRQGLSEAIEIVWKGGIE